MALCRLALFSFGYEKRFVLWNLLTAIRNVLIWNFCLSGLAFINEAIIQNSLSAKIIYVLPPRPLIDVSHRWPHSLIFWLSGPISLRA